MKNYEQEYKEALKRARDLHDNHPYGEPPVWMTCEEIFPVLKESEDEKIRNRLIEFISCNPCIISDLDKEKALDWLEKQGQEKSIDMSIKEKAHQIAWETSKHYDQSLSKESWCEMAALDMASWLEKQGEQKPADKVEPKFKIGDWVTIKE